MLSDNLFSRGHGPRSTRPWLMLCVMSMLQFFVALDVTVVNIALPSIGRDFGVGGHALTWVVVGYTIAGGGLLMLGGRLADLWGRRRVLVAGATLFGAASLLAGLAPSFAVLVLARLLQGAGEAIALPAAMATIVVMFPEGARRSRALSVWAAVASCGLVLGFVLSGIITAHLGWRWIFLISVPFIVAVVIAVLLLVEADRSSTRAGAPLDLWGAALLTACPLLFTYGVVQAGEPGAGLWGSLTALAGAALAGLGFVRVESRAARPLVPLGLLGNRARVAANLTTMLLSGALSTSFLLFTFYLQDVLGIGPLGAGVMMLPLAVSLLAATMLVPRLLGRWGARAGVLRGLGFAAGAMIAIAMVAGLDAGALWLIPAMVLIAAGMGFGLVALQYIAVSGTTDEDAGIASGIQRAADQLGGAAGVAIYIGVGFAPALHTADPFLIATVLAVAGLIVGAAVIARAPAAHAGMVQAEVSAARRRTARSRGTAGR